MSEPDDNILKLAGAEPDAPEPGYRLQEQVGFLLRKAHQRHVAIFAEAVPDLTPPQFAVLAMLAECGAASQSQLGGMVAMDAATVKGVVDRLQARGLLALAPHAGDRRRLTVSLSGPGRMLVAELIEAARGATAATLQPLSPREAETLLRLLARIA